ncbi:MAG: site-specific integrase [bacterium]|nr:site-specific integrase [bacterium]
MSRRSGQIRRRGDQKWLVTIYLGTHPDTGKRIYESKTVHGTKAVAEKALRQLLTQRDLGELHTPSRLPLSEYLDRWISDAVEDRVRPRTLQDYQRFLEPVRATLGARPLNQVTPIDVQQLLKGLPSAHGARRTHAVLRAALRQAVRWGYIATSPVDGVQAPRESRTEMLALSAAQARAFREAAKSVPRGFVFVFSMATGMRPGEVQGLRWDDCDLEAGVVCVERSLAWIDGKPDKRTGKRGKIWKLGEPKTRLSRRRIPLPASIAADLRGWRRAQLAWRLKLKRAYNDHGFVFAGELGEPIRNSNLSRRVLKPILKAAELPEDLKKRFRWYDCRHTCATLLLESGVNPKIVSERLGHSTVAFTLDRYAHVLPGQQEEASAALEAALTS